jgi:hypothetical protein
MGRYPDDDDKPQLFPFLDEWLKMIPTPVHVVMGIIGGFVGYYLFPYYGWLVPRQGGFVGAFVGFMWPYMLVALIRMGAWIAIIGGILWFAYWLLLEPFKR